MYNVLSIYMLFIPINIFWYFATNCFMNVSIYSYLDHNMEDWYQALLLFWWIIQHTLDYHIYLNVQRINANYKYIYSTRYLCIFLIFKFFKHLCLLSISEYFKEYLLIINIWMLHNSSAYYQYLNSIRNLCLLSISEYFNLLLLLINVSMLQGISVCNSYLNVSRHPC